MDSNSKTLDSPIPISTRHKCPACFKQYKKKEHLVDHMRVSYHSVHQPKCGVCKKHCKSLESVREHLSGPLSKDSCANLFMNRGCSLCLKIFETSSALSAHQELCHLSPAPCLDLEPFFLLEEINIENENVEFDLEGMDQHREVVAIDCEMVGGGSDGTLDLCARVCMIDENEKVIFHSFVKPQIPITDYRFEKTGIAENQLMEATPLVLVKQKVEEILYNGESTSRARFGCGRAKILVGHNLDHDLDCLRITYPEHLLRDTAKYPPLMKTNLVSYSLKYLTETYLGYEIQSSTHDPYEDCVAALRIYKRMRADSHKMESGCILNSSCSYYSNKRIDYIDIIASRTEDLEPRSPEALLEMSCTKYRCWCADAKLPNSC